MIFPDEVDYTEVAESELPIYKDWAVDFENGCLLIENGKPSVVEGLEALAVWIYKALKTERGLYLAYSDDFGEEFPALIGETDREYIERLLMSMISDALTVSPYILDVEGYSFAYDGSTVSASFTVNTVYGATYEEVLIEI